MLKNLVNKNNNRVSTRIHSKGFCRVFSVPWSSWRRYFVDPVIVDDIKGRALLRWVKQRANLISRRGGMGSGGWVFDKVIIGNKKILSRLFLKKCKQPDESDYSKCKHNIQNTMASSLTGEGWDYGPGQGIWGQGAGWGNPVKLGRAREL